MSIVAPHGTVAPGTLDISHDLQVPLTRLVKVEMRKMVDTRAGLWLIIAIVAITALITVIFFFAAPDDERTFLNYMGVMATPQGFLLPVLGILLITQEWSQRTGMVTFTLEPHRGKVIGAKVSPRWSSGCSPWLLAIVLAALGTAVSGAPGRVGEHRARRLRASSRCSRSPGCSRASPSG